MWLYDSVSNAWHLWPIANPTIGTPAWCGHLMTADCGPTGGTECPTRCQTCQYNFTRSRPQRA